MVSWEVAERIVSWSIRDFAFQVFGEVARSSASRVREASELFIYFE